MLSLNADDDVVDVVVAIDSLLMFDDVFWCWYAAFEVIDILATLNLFAAENELSCCCCCCCCCSLDRRFADTLCILARIECIDTKPAKTTTTNLLINFEINRLLKIEIELIIIGYGAVSLSMT